MFFMTATTRNTGIAFIPTPSTEDCTSSLSLPPGATNVFMHHRRSPINLSRIRRVLCASVLPTEGLTLGLAMFELHVFPCPRASVRAAILPITLVLSTETRTSRFGVVAWRPLIVLDPCHIGGHFEQVCDGQPNHAVFLRLLMPGVRLSYSQPGNISQQSINARMVVKYVPFLVGAQPSSLFHILPHVHTLYRCPAAESILGTSLTLRVCRETRLLIGP